MESAVNFVTEDRMKVSNICFVILLLLTPLYLVGCSGKVWRHPSRGVQDFHRDSAKCEVMGNSAGSAQIVYGGSPFANGWNQGTTTGSIIARKRIYNSCMVGEGWQLTTEPENTHRGE